MVNSTPTPSSILSLPPELRQQILSNLIENVTIHPNGKVKLVAPGTWLICRTLTEDMNEIVKTWFPTPDICLRVLNGVAFAHVSDVVRSYHDKAKTSRCSHWNGVSIELMWHSRLAITLAAKYAERYSQTCHLEKSANFPILGSMVAMLPYLWRIPARRELPKIWTALRSIRFNIETPTEASSIHKEAFAITGKNLFEYTFKHIQTALHEITMAAHMRLGRTMVGTRIEVIGRIPPGNEPIIRKRLKELHKPMYGSKLGDLDISDTKDGYLKVVGEFVAPASGELEGSRSLYF